MQDAQLDAVGSVPEIEYALFDPSRAVTRISLCMEME